MIFASCFAFSASAAEVVDSGTCGNNLTRTLTDDGVLEIGGSGDMEKYNSSSTFAPWSSYGKITTVIIGDEVTSIGSDAFYNCDSLEKVHISSINSWMNISFANDYSNPLSCGADLYLDGEGFTNLTIPNKITKLKNYTFYNCKSLKTITVPKTVTSIPDNAFIGCTITPHPTVVLPSFTRKHRSINLFSFTVHRSKLP